MLEGLLSDIVQTRLGESLTQFRLAPQIKPHALVEAKERLEKLDTKAILDLIKQVDLCETTARIELDIDKVSSLIQTEISKLDLELLRIEEPVTLRKRTNGTKLTWVGYKGRTQSRPYKSYCNSSGVGGRDQGRTVCLRYYASP